MKKYLIYTVSLIVCLCICLSFSLTVLAAEGQSVTEYKYSAAQDCYISSLTSSQKTTPTGGDLTVRSHTASGSVRSYLQFSITGYENIATVSSVELFLNVDASSAVTDFSGFSVRALPPEENSWDENAVTWSDKTGVSFSSSNAVTVKSTDYDEKTRTLIISLDPQVLATYAYTDADTGESLISLAYYGVSMYVCSREGAAAGNGFAPYLEVNRSFAVTTEAGAGGSVTSSADSVLVGENVSFTVKPNENYAIFSALLNGTDILPELTANENGEYIYEVTNVQEALNLKVSFISNDAAFYEITLSPTENGSVKASKSMVTEGESVTYEITPDEHYEIESVLVNGIDYTSSVSGGTLTLTPTESQTLTVTFKPAEDQYTFSLSVVGEGAAWIGSDESSTSVTKWESEWTVSGNLELTVIPAAGYVIDSVTLGDESPDVPGYKLSIPYSKIKSDLICKVLFTKDEINDETLKFYPTADTYVTSGDPDTAYGADQAILVKRSSSGGRVALFGFDLTHVTDFSSVNLNLYNSLDGTFGGYKLTVYAFTGLALDERASTWNSLGMSSIITTDDLGLTVASMGTEITVIEQADFKNKTWTKIDVSSFVLAAKLSGMESVTFAVVNSAIDNSNGKPVSFASKESNLLVNGELARPYLSVTKGSATDALNQPTFNLNVIGMTSVKINGVSAQGGEYRYYTPIAIDLGDLPESTAVSSVTVNGEQRELVDGVLYLNGMKADVTVNVITVALREVNVVCDEGITADTATVTVEESGSVTVRFKTDAGCKAAVTVNGMAFYCSDNVIILEDITETTEIKIVAVKIR